MQLLAAGAPLAGSTGPMLASQSIDIVVRAYPAGGSKVRTTEREYRLAGARAGIDTFASITDAMRAASALSAGAMPGLAVVTFRGGFRIHDVHAASRTYWSTSPHAPQLPGSRVTKQSSVPFAAGNLRLGNGHGGRYNPAVVRSDALVALVDGARTFVPSPDVSWAGRPRLVEVSEIAAPA